RAAEILLQFLRPNRERSVLVSRRDNLPRDFAGEGTDLPLQLPHAGFMRVVLNQPFQGRVRKFYPAALESVFFELARNEVSLGNLDFFRGRVTGDADGFQSIAQRGMNWIEPVRRGDEQDLRQV